MANVYWGASDSPARLEINAILGRYGGDFKSAAKGMLKAALTVAGDAAGHPDRQTQDVLVAIPALREGSTLIVIIYAELAQKVIPLRIARCATDYQGDFVITDAEWDLARRRWEASLR